MTIRSLSMRTTLTAIFTLAALLSAGLPATAKPSAAELDAPAETTLDGVESADTVELSTEAQASAELAADQGVTLERQVLEKLDSQGAADFWVDLDKRADLSRAAEIDDWAERGQYVYDQLVRTANASQAKLTTALAALGVDHETFWISNTVLIRGGDKQVLDGLLRLSEVGEIRADELITLPEPIEASADATVNAVEWGIANIRADQVWGTFGVRGEGIVIGNIDSGVDYTHPALVNQYRGNQGNGQFVHDHNWWDPSAVCPEDQPCDNNNHGTHTMGTMVGDDGAGNQIGVAPAARWIAAKGCESRTCSDVALLSSGQFMLAPTDLNGDNPRPDLRPQVVNNSWGGPGGNEFYDDVVAAWVAAGIFPAFANGNDGPGCGTAGSPADGPDAYAVGAYDSSNQIANFSSRGPGRSNEIRPSISAPGVDVRSSIPGGYAVASGTSMATPHTAGTVALMWSALGDVGDIGATREALAATAVDTDDTSCGGTSGNNNVYGQGRLDAFEATSQLAIISGITGVVTDGFTDEPLAGVTIARAGAPDLLTDENGRYTLRALAGTYALEYSKFGYATKTVPDIVVTEDNFTEVDVELVALGTGGATGTVTDHRSGQTIPGTRVQLLDVPGDVSATTDSDGAYTLTGIPEGTYQMRVTSTRPGQWWPAEAEVTVTPDATAQVDVGLPRVEGIEPISVSSDGHEANSAWSSFSGADISADGRFVTFSSGAGPLADVPIDGEYNTFVHDRQTGVTELAPGGSPLNENPTGSIGTTISDDGRYVAFSGPPNVLQERLPDTPPLPRYWPPLDREDRAYVFDRTTGEIELASVNSHGETVGNRFSVGPVLTPDGRFAAFASSTPHLVDEPLPACHTVFELQIDRCQQIAVHDHVTGETDVVSVSSDGEMGNANDNGGHIAITPDGQTVAFNSRATNLVEEQTHPGSDIFVHDRDTGETEWVSVLPGGIFGNYGSPRISDDGSVVTYDRPLASAVVYDRDTGQSEVLPSPPADIEPAFTFSAVVAMSSDGRRITYVSAAFDASFTPIPELTGMYVLDRETDQVEPMLPFDLEATGPVDLTPDGRHLLVMNDGDTLMPGDGNSGWNLYVVDLDFDVPESQALFAVWDLSVQPERPRPGEPVEVTARVKNVGDVTGDYEATLLVDSEREPSASETVTLAPGEAAEVSLTVVRDDGGDHRVRIGQAAGGFEVQSGTLAGQVTDANDGNAVDGAVVTAVSGDVMRTATVSRSAYQFDELPLGRWTVTVSAKNYATETFEVTLTEDGQQITRDVALRTGVATPERNRVDVSIPAGNTHVFEVNLSNAGTADLLWQASGWDATTEEEPSILMYTSSTSGDTHVDQALRKLALDYTAIREEHECIPYGFDPPPFNGILEELPAALEDGWWDLVIVDQWCSLWSLPQQMVDALQAYVAEGGRLIIRSESFRFQNPFQRPLWEALGITYTGQPDTGHFGSEAYPVRWWDADHPLYTTPFAVPEFDRGRQRSSAIGPQRELVEVSEGVDALAGYTLTARPGHAALVLGNDGRTLYNGFWYGDWSVVPGESEPSPDVDQDGVPDGVELLVNSIVHVGGLETHPWLSVEPSGTVAPGSSTAIPISVDATHLTPGTYTSSITIAANGGREALLTVPLRLRVTEAITFDSLREKVRSFRVDGDVTAKGARRLLSVVGDAERLYNRGRDLRAIERLERFQQIAGDPTYVPGSEAREVLVTDAEWLIARLSAGALGGPHGLVQSLGTDTDQSARASGFESVPA